MSADIILGIPLGLLIGSPILWSLLKRIGMLELERRGTGHCHSCQMLSDGMFLICRGCWEEAEEGRPGLSIVSRCLTCEPFHQGQERADAARRWPRRPIMNARHRRRMLQRRVSTVWRSSSSRQSTVFLPGYVPPHMRLDKKLWPYGEAEDAIFELDENGVLIPRPNLRLVRDD